MEGEQKVIAFYQGNEEPMGLIEDLNHDKQSNKKLKKGL